MALYTVQGNTYPNREKIKALGFKWHAATRSWVTPKLPSLETIGKLEAIKGITLEYRDQVSHQYLIDTRTYKQTYGRCEDAPCCGCCGPQYL